MAPNTWICVVSLWFFSFHQDSCGIPVILFSSCIFPSSPKKTLLKRAGTWRYDYWSKKFGHGFCVAWRILARPRWPVYYRSGRRTRHHAFTCLCKSFSSCLSLKKHDMREVSREQHQIIKWKLNWLATSCYKEGFIVYSLRGASGFHSVAAVSINQFQFQRAFEGPLLWR